MAQNPTPPAGIKNAHTQSDLAKFFGVERETIMRWTKKGMPVASREKGAVWYDSKEVIAWKQAQTSGSSEDGTEELRRRKLVAETEQQEVEALRVKGEVADLDVVGQEFTQAFMSMRARLLQLPSLATPLILGETDETTMKQELKTLVHEALSELSECRWCESETD